MNENVKCKECMHYYKLDGSCGLCRLYTPQLRVDKESSCKHGKIKQEEK